MIIQTIKDLLPSYAKDIVDTFELATNVNKAHLTEVQIWGSVYSAAIAARNPKIVNLFEEQAKAHLSEKEMEACKGAAALMAMNNIYWRFWYLVEDKDYLSIPDGLSKALLTNHHVEEVDFECWALAVSVINACAGCNKTHSRKLLKIGFSKEQVLSIVRIAAVIHSIAATLEAEGF